ncbi:MAG: hypothetical protein C5B51_29430 [Terriglobia bacterium]|nr:MAG: hypothetical protein C5B51_29430 [Terriglobia bacterium]
MALRRGLPAKARPAGETTSVASSALASINKPFVPDCGNFYLAASVFPRIRSVIIRLTEASMDATQLQKRIVLFVAAGMLVGTTGRAADLVVNNSNVVITSSVLSQTVQVTSASPTTFTMSIAYADAGVPAWLRASADNNNTTTSNVTVALTNALTTFGNGPFNATVTLTPDSGAAATIKVQYQPGISTPPSNVTVVPSPANPNYPLTLSYNTGAALPQQSVNISGAVSYTASITYDTSGVLQVTAAGQTPGTAVSVTGSQLLVVQLSQAAAQLATGTYYGTIAIYASNGQATISVTIAVNGGLGNGLVVSPASLVFAYQNGGQITTIPQQTLAITSPSGTTYNTTVTSDRGWLFLGAPQSGTVPGYVQIYAVLPQGGLAAGTYNGTITVTAGTLTQNINVQFIVSDSPVLVPTVLSTGGGTVLFNIQNGVATPASQTVTLQASDRSTLTGLALVAPLPTFANVNLNGTTLTITPIAGLSGAVYSGTVIVSNSLVNALFPIPVIVVGNTSGAGGYLTLSQSSYVFQALVNGTPPSSQTLTVNAPATTNFYATSNAPWLSISPSGQLQTPMTITVSVNPAAAGSVAATLSSTISLVANNVTQNVTVTLQLSSTGTGGNVTTDQSSLSFTAQAGGSAPGPKYLVVSNAVAGTAGIVYTVSTSASWLTASPQQGTTQSTITVTANPAGLSAGNYSATITITPSGGAVLTIPVTLTVQPAAVISATPTSLTFTYRVGGALPSAQTVQTSGGTFAAQASPDAPWLSVSPASGGAGGSITVTANPAGLNPGAYTGTITVSGTNNAAGIVTINVTLTISAPLPTITQVVNAASFQVATAMSAGELITLTGTGLGPATAATAQLDSSGKIATQLGGVQVTVNGFAAPLVYVSSTQVSAVVPYELVRFLNASASVSLRYLGQTSNGVSILVAPTNPGIFTQNSSGTGPGAFNANFSLNGPNNPVAKGGSVTFFLTGEGQTNPPGVTGTVNSPNGGAPAPVANVVVLIDGQPAQYTYAGGVPGAVEGVMQLNVTIPSTARSGDLSVVVSIGGVGSQSGVTVSVL